MVDATVINVTKSRGIGESPLPRRITPAIGAAGGGCKHPPYKRRRLQVLTLQSGSLYHLNRGVDGSLRIAGGVLP